MKVAAILMIAFSTVCAVHSWATIPDPSLSEVPPIFIAPDCPSCNQAVKEYRVAVNGIGGPIAGAMVTIEFSSYSDGIIAWCVGQQHPLISATTNISGEATFEIHGGGCIEPSVSPSLPVARVFANDVLLKEVGVVSPDVVDANGKKPTDPWNPGSTSGCTQSDAVYFTPHIQGGAYDYCTDLNGDGAVGIGDVVILTPYINSGAFCNIQ